MTDRPKVHPLQRAWAAGVFDAKGVLNSTKKCIKIESSDESMVRRFAETVGVGSFVPDRRGSKNMGLHTWQALSNNDIREALLFLLPLLSPIKTRAAATMLSKIERSPVWREQNPEKAATLVTVRVQSADTNQPAQDTTQGGPDASLVKRTSDGKRAIRQSKSQRKRKTK